jgi:hypothetical protein
MKSLPMIAESVRVDLNRSAAMSVEAETAIVEHLGRQYQGVGPTWCTSIPAVTTRAASRCWQSITRLARTGRDFCEIFPNETFADCIAARLPASGGDNRPIVLMDIAIPYSPTAPPPSGPSA